MARAPWRRARSALLTGHIEQLDGEPLLFPPDVALLRELRWFEIKRGPSGNVKYKAAAGQKNDRICPIALALSGCGGIVKQESFASLGLPPFLRSNDRLTFSSDERPVILGPLEDGFPDGSWQPGCDESPRLG